jgi:predicted O-methyltransferase YrrM
MSNMSNFRRFFQLNSYAKAGGMVRRGWRFGKLRYLQFESGLGDSVWVLYGLVRALRPDVCVEIGSARGKSACYIAMALEENNRGKLYAIDPHTTTDWNDTQTVDSFSIIQRNLHFVGVSPRVELIRKLSPDAASSWNQKIDLLFVDGDHSYEGVRQDWELFRPHMSKFGVVAFHDTAWEVAAVDENIRRSDMGVPRLVDELRQEGYPVITLPNDCGLSIVQPTKFGVPIHVAPA